MPLLLNSSFHCVSKGLFLHLCILCVWNEAASLARADQLEGAHWTPFVSGVWNGSWDFAAGKYLEKQTKTKPTGKALSRSLQTASHINQSPLLLPGSL